MFGTIEAHTLTNIIIQAIIIDIIKFILVFIHVIIEP